MICRESHATLVPTTTIDTDSTLFIPTNSLDGTADAIVVLCGEWGVPVFRWNIDLWYHYKVRVNNRESKIFDPAGNSIDLKASNSLCLWRKPLLDLVLRDADSRELPILKGQLRGFLSYISNYLLSQGRIRLIEPFADSRLPKLNQLDIAVAYFKVPEYSFTTNPEEFGFDTAVVKPLTESQLTTGEILYSTLVATKTLRTPFPWFMNQALISGRDVTCVYINKSVYFYVCEFVRSGTSVDWRVEINTEQQSKWKPLKGGIWESHAQSVIHIMESFNLYYGRLDFILDENGELWFLECNSNGQFGWLDDSKLTLHNRFLEAALCTETTIYCRDYD